MGCELRAIYAPFVALDSKRSLNNDYTSMSITQSSFSVRGRRGVGVVPPMDANSQDVTMLDW